jgi:3-oxoacyl-[acyl-carrier protein] reductase
MGKLDGKVIVVTGASRGLGEAMAIGYAKEGANLVLGARTIEDLERVAKECREAGAASVTVVPTDITDEQQVNSLVEKAKAEHGRVDVFVANAGTSYANLTDKRYGELVSYDLPIVEQLFNTNAIGTWISIKAALQVMGPGSSLITIGSEAGRVRYPRAGIYAVTKSAVDAMSEITAKEFAEKGVRVNVLSPGGMVDTQLFGPQGMPDFLKQHGHLEPEVMVEPAVWLASDASEGVTGQFISAKEFDPASFDRSG